MHPSVSRTRRPSLPLVSVSNVFQKSTLMDLKEGDLVQALDVKIPPHSSFTVKMQAWAERPVFLLARRGETGFSIKLRFWMQRESRRPSTSS